LVRAGRNVLHVIEQAGTPPHSQTDRGQPGGGLPRVSAREIWGYAVWLFIGLVFGVPESWSGIANPPWQTLSITMWHLEAFWNPTTLIVVVTLVFLIFGVIRHPPGLTGYTAARPGEFAVGRTANGRLTRASADAIKDLAWFVYFPVALGIIAVGSILASLSNNSYDLAYAIYGLFAVFCVIVPDVLAYWFARDVPFPTLARTVANLERRWSPAAMVVTAGLVLLTFHLAFPQWPGGFEPLGTG
jgi:hypothetical protein